MPWVAFYNPDTNQVEQLWVPNGTPLDATSALGIIALNLDEFPGIPETAEVEPPEPPDPC